MPAPPCPQCGAQTRFGGYEPWCPACGWNREVAAARLRRPSRAIPFFYLISVVMFGAFFRVWHAPRPFTLLIVFVFPAVPLLLFYASLRWSQKRFERDVRDAEAGVRPAAPPELAPPAPSPAADLRILKEMPRPRPVRMSRRGKINLLVTMITVAAFEFIFLLMAWKRYASGGRLAGLSKTDWMWTGFALLLALAPLGVWKNLQKQKALLESGEIALARVLRRMRDESSSTIKYEFEDAQGNKASGMASDMTQSLYEGMSVVVFFDAQNSRRRVAQCECFCEVVLPGVE